MFETIKHVFLGVAVVLLNSKICAFAEPVQPTLVLYSPGDLEYTDVLVRRVRDNLTLVCEVRGDPTPRVYVWNYVSGSGVPSGRPFTVDPESGPSASSRLERAALQADDSGHYMCSAPPFSVTKYILVQAHGRMQCARGAFACGARCVLAGYVCDGRRDCARAEDEAPRMCTAAPCLRSDKLNCSSGRCISEAACCRPADPLCREHACCAEHQRHLRLDGGYADVDYPQLFEDRHAPDDYGFIQSTIYTVTACALIFMIAVVLLVSALCKMHMKRAALRDYAHARHATAHHYSARYPPRYEATRLLEASALPSPVRQPLQTCAPHSPAVSPCSEQQAGGGAGAPPCGEDGAAAAGGGFGLARLSAIFSTRYRQVPTQCCDVEMTDVRPASLAASPTRARPLTEYRSPTYCDLDYLAGGRDLNYPDAPVEFYRRRMRRNTLDRVMGRFGDGAAGEQRPLTLHLGRFQFSIPRFGRRSEVPRPDTPDVAEINIDDLEFVRLNSNETYTLNGRTIRLLGGDFENYPVMENGQVRPPPYAEAVRCKVYGPPPEYLSREGLERGAAAGGADEERASTNVEMPPRYDELAGADVNANVCDVRGDVAADGGASCDVNASNADAATAVDVRNSNNVYSDADAACNTNSVVSPNVRSDDVNCNSVASRDVNVHESISSVIDNLPAIDSDFNANDTSCVVGDVDNFRT